MVGKPGFHIFEILMNYSIYLVQKKSHQLSLAALLTLFNIEQTIIPIAWIIQIPILKKCTPRFSPCTKF